MLLYKLLKEIIISLKINNSINKIHQKCFLIDHLKDKLLLKELAQFFKILFIEDQQI
jgi:hypothetical protein